MYLHTTPQKSLFIAFLLTNFLKITKKVLKNFSRRLRRRKRVEISPFFDPRSVDGTPLPTGVTPQNIYDIEVVYGAEVTKNSDPLSTRCFGIF